MTTPRSAAWIAAVVALGATVGFSATAVAFEFTIREQQFRLDITSTTSLAWHTGTDAFAGKGSYGELFERLNLAASKDAWRLALRVDTSTFFSEPSPQVTDRYSLEKASIGWTGRSLSVTFGDAYVSFGRGLALSLRKIDELGVDTTLRGAKLLFHRGIFGGTVVFGYANFNNVDEASGKSVDDPYDLIGGLQGQVTLGDKLTVGAHGTLVAFRQSTSLVPTPSWRDRYFQVGPTIDAPRVTEHFGFYLEGIAQIRDTESTSSGTTGFGAYGTATIYAGPASILFEGKAYGNLAPIKPNLGVPEFSAVAYNNPPTAERVLQIIENPQRNIAGGRMDFGWKFSPSVILHVNYGAFRDREGYADPLNLGVTRSAVIIDPYAGVEVRWNEARSWALLTTGWRGVFIDGSHVLIRADAHLKLDAAQSLGRRWSLTLNALHLERKKYESPILDESFREGTLQLGFKWRPHLTAAAGYDYTTEPTQIAASGRDYFNGNVEWHITPSSSLKAFAGATRGGLRCVSGVCRVFPPFEGGKLVAILRF